ncbi:cation transporter [Patescibacteria group bacterium]|nr:cation transporter [Patescibacteria group bacterium]
MGYDRCDHTHLIEDRTRIAIALLINLFVVPLEIWGGIFSGSFSLLSDGFHMTSHLALLSFACFVETKKKYEFYSVFLNSLFLIRLAMFMFCGALWRIFSPAEILGATMLWISCVGLFGDIVQIFLMYPASRDHSRNMMSIFAHTLSDASFSFAIVVGAICVYFWKISGIDAVVLLVFFPQVFIWGLKLTKEIFCWEKK